MSTKYLDLKFVVYFNQHYGAAPPNAGQKSIKNAAKCWNFFENQFYENFKEKILFLTFGSLLSMA